MKKNNAVGINEDGKRSKEKRKNTEEKEAKRGERIQRNIIIEERTRKCEKGDSVK